MSRYQVTTFDLCTPGSERLRARTEFILLAYPEQGDTAAITMQAWLNDIQSCERGEAFDYDAANACVRQFAADEAAWIESTIAAVDWLEARRAPEDSDPLTAYLFVKDTEAA